MMGQRREILRVQNLKVFFHTVYGPAKAVNDISLTLHEGERLGLVGESGSGKTTTALALMRLIKEPGKIEGGQILLDGRDLAPLSEEEIRKVRFSKLAMVPQGAMNSLNPVMRIREQLADTMIAHDVRLSRGQMDERIAGLLERVGLGRHVAGMYPHELSGGMKQRVCIAIAISLSPQVIIADEPTSALDVVVQRQVMETLGKVQEDLGAAVILVGHDMGLMAQFVDRLGVMYAGKLVELGPVRELFREPLHPYSQMLIQSIPSLTEKQLFRGIPGVAPSLLSPPPGCPFHPRCRSAMPHCSEITPRLAEIRPGHWAACLLYEGTS
jgi:peptide/nickel transport system ATP-binding protein